MKLLQSFENAITLYGASPKNELEKTKTRLEHYRHDKWQAALLEKTQASTLLDDYLTLKHRLKVLETAINHLAHYPSEDARLYHGLLYHRYLAVTKIDKPLLMVKYHIEERTYYRRKKEAMTMLALILLVSEN